MDENLNDKTHRDSEIPVNEVWTDPESLNEGNQLKLPPKRPKKSNDNPANRSVGLRIDPASQPTIADDACEEAGLEVSVISPEVVRLNPETPSVERVPRQYTFHQRQDDEETHRQTAGETTEWGHSKKISRQSILWMVGCGLAVALVVVGALILLPRINRSKAVDSRPGQMGLTIVNDPGDSAKPISDMLGLQNDAERLYQTWLTATSKEEIASLIRDSKNVLPLIADNALPRLSANEALREYGMTWDSFERDGLIFGMLVGLLKNHTPFVAYFVMEDDVLKMDWKATTAYSSAGFSTLAQGKGDASEVRGWIIPSDYYTLAYPETHYQSFQLLSRDQSEFLWIYTPLSNSIHRQLSIEFGGGFILDGSLTPKKFTLKLKRESEQSLPNQWTLVELLHKNWISP